MLEVPEITDFSKESRESALKLLQEPDLWKTIDGELAVTIREDAEARQACFAVMLSAFQPKPCHLMLLGSTAVGKTWLAKNTSLFFPPENVIVLGSSTQRAWFYCGEAVHKPHPLIPGKEIIDYYKVDWRNKIVIILDNVRPDTIKDLKPIMSHDQPVIDLQTTERTSGGSLKTRKVKTYGCPAFVNCSTWLSWEQELTSRHFYLTPKDTPEKFKAAAEYLSEAFTTGTAPTSQILPIIHDAIRHLMAQNTKVVIHPDVNRKLSERFKWKSGRDVRDYERAATITEAVAWFHALQRERTEQGEIIADQRDLEIMNGFIEPLLRTSHYGTSSQVLDFYERILKPLAANGDVHQNDAATKYIQVYDRPASRDELYDFMKVLERLGKIELIQDPQDKRRRLIRLTGSQTEL